MEEVSSTHQPTSTPAVRSNAAAQDGRQREPRNTFWIVVYQLLVRVGWLFKTETVIMPAVLDAVVDSGTLRGLLPVLNRVGQSLPPIFLAGPLARMRRKWPATVATTAIMAGCFGLLAVVWEPLSGSRPELLAAVFLVLYGIFAAFNGVNQLVLATLQGKLIAPGNRGRAMVASVTVGSVLAIVVAMWLLGPWLAAPDGFTKIFAATAICFAVAAIVPAFLDEPADPVRAALPPSAGGWASQLSRGAGDWWQTLIGDRALVRLSAVAACFSAVIMLFPHYQAFARDALGAPLTSLVTWVVVQNVATGLVSLVAGPVADRRGTRIVLIGLVAISAVTPLIVTGLSLLPSEAAGHWFWLVYAPLGLNPVSLKILVNYALELAPTMHDHPRYVSIVGAALAAPFVLSPAIGYAVDAIGFQPVFVAGAGVIAAGALIAFGLPEPRHQAGIAPRSDPAV